MLADFTEFTITVEDEKPVGSPTFVENPELEILIDAILSCQDAVYPTLKKQYVRAKEEIERQHYKTFVSSFSLLKLFIRSWTESEKRYSHSIIRFVEIKCNFKTDQWHSWILWLVCNFSFILSGLVRFDRIASNYLILAYFHKLTDWINIRTIDDNGNLWMTKKLSMLMYIIIVYLLCTKSPKVQYMYIVYILP